MVSPAKPVRVVEYDHEGEFRHLGYTASLTARSRTAEKALTALTRRAAKVFATKPDLRDCGVSIVPSMLVPKTVYHFVFGKTTVAAVEETERGYGGIIRQSLGVARGSRGTCSRARWSTMAWVLFSSPQRRRKHGCANSNP